MELKEKIIGFWHRYDVLMSGNLSASKRDYYWHSKLEGATVLPAGCNEKYLLLQTLRVGDLLAPGLELWTVDKDAVGRVLTTSNHVASFARKRYLKTADSDYREGRVDRLNYSVAFGPQESRLILIDLLKQWGLL